MDKDRIKEALKHLSDDIKGYQKQISHLKKEIQEDKELKSDLKKSKCSCTKTKRKKAKKKK